MWLTWLLTVAALTTSASAISAFVRPAAISASTSASRGVSSSGSPGAAVVAGSSPASTAPSIPAVRVRVPVVPHGVLSHSPAKNASSAAVTASPSPVSAGCGSLNSTEASTATSEKGANRRTTRGGGGGVTTHTVCRLAGGVIAARVDPSPPVGGEAGSARAPMTEGAGDPILWSMLTNSLEAAAVARSAAPAPPDAAPAAAAIAARGVRKAYGGVQALAGVDLTVRRGELLALLGPNGAGKTTLLEILEGHRRADAGEVSVLGHDPALRERALRERTGIVLQEEGLDPNLDVREAVELYGAAYPAPRPAGEVLELVGLADRADARAATLSGGQRRRLDLALGIAGDPELIFLDEPTTGFDPGARRRSWELIRRLREMGKTILLTTHYMEEAQVLADRVVVLSGGRVIAEGTPDTLGGGGESIVSYRENGRIVRFTTTTPTMDLAPILTASAERGEELEGLTVTRPSLEDVYLELTEDRS